MALLELENLSIQFGGLKAVSNVNLSLEQGSLTGLIGPNGAGKTTLFNMLTGVYRPSEGKIQFDGRSLVGRKPHQITRAGIGRTFQNVRLFGNLSVIDNVRIAAQCHGGPGLAASLLGTRGQNLVEQKQTRDSLELLRLFKLEGKRNDLARNLPYGEQRRLEIARALATKPKLLCLDEPAAGMNPQETAELTALIRELRDRMGISILLIEHDMACVMSVCEKIFVLEYGVLIAQGAPAEIRSNPKVIEAYLGVEVDNHA